MDAPNNKESGSANPGVGYTTLSERPHHEESQEPALLLPDSKPLLAAILPSELWIYSSGGLMLSTKDMPIYFDLKELHEQTDEYLVLDWLLRNQLLIVKWNPETTLIEAHAEGVFKLPAWDSTKQVWKLTDFRMKWDNSRFATILHAEQDQSIVTITETAAQILTIWAETLSKGKVNTPQTASATNSGVFPAVPSEETQEKDITHSVRRLDTSVLRNKTDQTQSSENPAVIILQPPPSQEPTEKTQTDELGFPTEEAAVAPVDIDVVLARYLEEPAFPLLPPLVPVRNTN